MNCLQFFLSFLIILSRLSSACAGYCEARTLITNNSGVITDGEGDYVSYESCMFILKLNDTSQRIKLTFNEMDLECGWDYLNIFNGDSLQHPKLLSLSGDQVKLNGVGELAKLQVESSSSSLLLLFLTDAAATSSGFNISYSSSGSNTSYSSPLSQTDLNLTSGVCYSDCNQTCFLYNNTLFSQCGRNETVAWNGITATTLRSTSAPLPTAGHSAVLYQGCIYIYGGYTFESQFEDSKKYYSLHKRCPPSELWEIVTPGPFMGPWPAPRYGHTSAVYKDAMYVYGGTIISNGNGQFRNEITNQLWRLNLTSMIWTYMVSSNDTLSTTGHVSQVAAGGRMLVFFGQSKDQSNLLYPREYLIESDQWVYHNNSKSPIGENEKLVYSSSAHSSLYNLVFVYGSKDPNSPSLYAYKPDSHTWLYLPSNSLSNTVYQQAMVLVNESYLVVTGGYKARNNICGFASTFVYDLKCGRWHRVETHSQAAFNLRQGHSLIADSPHSALMFGGYNQALLLNDLVSLRLPDFASLFNSSDCSDKIRCQHLSCPQCLTELSCEWDREDTLCQPASTASTAPTSSENGSAQSRSLCPPQDDGCGFLSNCWECQARPDCVWGGMNCSRRQSNDTSRLCDPGCGSLSCKDCMSKNYCLYCPSQESCVTSDYPVQFPYGQCLIWTKDKGNCTNSSSPDRCSAYKTCEECQLDFKCGWCSTHSTGLGDCMDGSLSSPTDTNSCSNFSWHYFDCPPCQCNGHSSCNDSSAQCVACQNNTQGDNCEKCAPWFHGDSRNGGSCSPCRCSKYGVGCDTSDGTCHCSAFGVIGDHCEECQHNGTVNTSCYQYQEPKTMEYYSTKSGSFIKSMLFMTQVAGQEQVTMELTTSLSGTYAFVHIYRAVQREKHILDSLSSLWEQLSPEVREELLQKLQQNTTNQIVEAFGELYELRRLDALVLLVASEDAINTSNYPSYQVYVESVRYQITQEDLGTDNDFIFFEFSNISTPFLIAVDLATDDVPLIVAVLVFLSVVLIFFIIMVLILLGWHIKKQIEFRQARVRRRRERIVMATRPASVTSLLASSVGPRADNFSLTRAIADQPLANSKVSLSTFLISMPSDPSDPNGMPLYCGTALVTAGRGREAKIFSNQST